MNLVFSPSSKSDFKPHALVNAAALSAIIWISVILCLAFVALRTWVQYRKAKRFYVNDYFIFLAMLCHIATAACYQVNIPSIYMMVRWYGNDEGAPEGFASKLAAFLRLKFTITFIIWTTLWAVKFSLLFFFWRLFESVRSKGKWFWWVMCFVTASTFIIAVILQFFTCESFADFFKFDRCGPTSKSAFHQDLVFRFSAGTDIAVDMLLLLIPFPLLKRLQVSKREKWILVTFFLLPMIPIAFGVVRLAVCDPKYKIMDPVQFPLYSILENATAIITACIPSLRLFARDVKLSSKGSSKWSSKDCLSPVSRPTPVWRGSPRPVCPIDATARSHEQVDSRYWPMNVSRASSPYTASAPSEIIVTRDYYVDREKGFF